MVSSPGKKSRIIAQSMHGSGAVYIKTVHTWSINTYVGEKTRSPRLHGLQLPGKARVSFMLLVLAVAILLLLMNCMFNVAFKASKRDRTSATQFLIGRSCRGTLYACKDFLAWG